MPNVMKSSKETTASLRQRWDARLDRLRNLELQPNAAREVLRFYGRVLEFQRDLAAALLAPSNQVAVLRAQLDLSAAPEHLDSLLSLTIQYGPAPLASHAKELQTLDCCDKAGLLERFLSAPQRPDGPEDFVVRAVLQPMAEVLQIHMEVESTSKPVCPACGGLPQLSILRPEGDGGARWLQCSFCLREWLFRRVVCPWCGEEDKEKLPRFAAEQCAHVHVYACDTCKRYLKSVDMRLVGRAVPLVDEVAMVSLDLWTVEQGFQKINLNLMGF